MITGLQEPCQYNFFWKLIHVWNNEKDWTTCINAFNYQMFIKLIQTFVMSWKHFSEKLCLTWHRLSDLIKIMMKISNPSTYENLRWKEIVKYYKSLNRLFVSANIDIHSFYVFIINVTVLKQYYFIHQEQSKYKHEKLECDICYEAPLLFYNYYFENQIKTYIK